MSLLVSTLLYLETHQSCHRGKPKLRPLRSLDWFSTPSFGRISFSIKAVISVNVLVTALRINYEFRSFFHVLDQLKTFTLPHSLQLQNVEITADLNGKKHSLLFAFFEKHTIILVHNFKVVLRLLPTSRGQKIGVSFI